MKSVMQHNFGQIPNANIPRSTFNRSHGHKTTFDAGYLIPVLVDEALPGDTINCKMTGLARLNTPIVPMMDNMYLDSFFFAIPYRLVWNNFQKFMGEQENPGDSTDYLVPRMQATAVTGYANQSLYDYMGLPTGVPGFYHNSLAMRSYNLCWNEFFRDQNLQDRVVVDKDDGPDNPADYVLLKRGKRKDYFTSCLPFPQKGEDVLLPLGDKAYVRGIGMPSTAWISSTNLTAIESGQWTSNPTYASGGSVGAAGNNFYLEEDPDHAGYPNIYADLSEATAATINELRQAFQVQRMLERDARGGTRYIELLKSHFQVTSPDFRLQRPELLSTYSSQINIHPVAQTSSTDGTSPQGNLSAFGLCHATGHGFTKSFTEHCIILGLISVRCDLNYQQGLDRMWSRRTRYDHYFPALANLGEQAVLSKEIYCDNTADDEDVFGYQERWAELRHKRSMVTGQMRSNYAQSLDIWHLAQDFSSRPELNDVFIQENPPLDRVIATPDEPHFKSDFYFNYIHTRAMPTYSVPGMIDHF